MGIDIVERARRYVMRLDPAVSGQGGNKTAMNAMMILVHGFGLTPQDSEMLFTEWNRANQPPFSDSEISRLVKNAGNRTSDKPTGYLAAGSGDYVANKNKGVAQQPRRKDASVPPFQPELLKKVIAGIPTLTRQDYKDRSPIPVDGMSAGAFIEHLYPAGSRVLIMTSFYSQGDFLWEVGRGGFRLGKAEGVKAVSSKLPRDGGKDGVWFLANPVSGKWEQSLTDRAKKTRRSKNNITEWRYAVLESDDAPEEHWLRLLAHLDIPIVAVYSSGKRSIHALVAVDQPTYEHVDKLMRLSFKKNLCPLGADGGALTAVRLSRLPACLRNGVEQELIYLNPDARHSPFQRILDCPARP